MSSIDAVSELIGDIRYSLRTLGRSPGFTAAAVLTLAIGLTGTIAMFTLVNGVLLRPLPVRDEAALVVGWRGRPDTGARQWPFTAADLDLLRRESRTLEGVAGVGYNDPSPQLLADGGEPAVIRGARVTGDFFAVLGVQPLLGRALRPEDDVLGAENALVLTHGLWQRRFGGAPEVVGRRVILAGQPFTIVGVMPKDVEHPRRVEAWMTVTGMQTTTSNPTARMAMATELNLLARLRAGVTTVQAGDELRTLGHALDALRPRGDGEGFVPLLQSYREIVIGDVRAALLVLFAAVGLVLLIACANVSSLLLVRGDARVAEFAVRAALGAGRGRIVRQLLVDGFVLAAAATAAALVATSWLLPGLLTWVPDGLPRLEVSAVDRRVVGFGVGSAFVVAMLAAMVPALTSVGHQLADHLKDAGRDGAGGGRRRWRNSLVAGQVALAMTGLACAGLLVNSLRQLRAESARLESDQLVAVPLAIPQAKYVDRQRWRQLITDLTASLAADARVSGVTPINATPFDGTGWDVPVFTVEGQSEDEARANPSLNLEEIHPGYFGTFEVGLTRGRSFTDGDREDTTRVAIVSADVAARAWPDQDPIGKRLKWGSPASTGPWLTVVGVSAPTRYRDLRIAWPTLYVPAVQMLGGADQIVVRTTMPTALLADLVRARLRALDPDVQMMPLRPFSQLLEVPMARPRFYTAVLAVFGATGVALAVVGLYGVIAASVRQRRREIGVRIALGAERRHVRRLVLADGAWPIGVGLAVGLLTSISAMQALRGLLFGVQPLDPTSLAAATVGVLLVSLAALALPMRLATRIDPAHVLRAD